MQTRAWMSYSNSTHFSDKISYKILFISSYGSKNMNLARFTHLQEFLEKKNRKTDGTSETETHLAWDNDSQGQTR
jgi:hypothetical protein